MPEFRKRAQHHGVRRKHDWRREITEELAQRQNSNGSWVNKNNRWLESDASLVTGFALLTLSYTK